MVYYLLTRDSKIKRHRSSTSPTTILAVYCINSGFLSLVFATICLVTAICYPCTLIYAPFWFILVRLYSCSFMAMLNSRDHLCTAFQVDPGYPTVSVSVTTHSSYPGTNSSSDVVHRVDDPSRFPRRTNTIRFAEDEGISLDMLESAEGEHEDKLVMAVESSDR
ncbi:hypothetical protein BGW80DRAFT_1261096 [Lactifluus volemus]|nr:hypothetical protein BGW80DRAFT_1261096 [Lactifluus volemus]